MDERDYKAMNSIKVRAEKATIETLDEYRNTIKFLESKCARLEKENEKLKKKNICEKCNGKGWYFVNEWIGTIQGRKDCNCKTH